MLSVIGLDPSALACIMPLSVKAINPQSVKPILQRVSSVKPILQCVDMMQLHQEGAQQPPRRHLLAAYSSPRGPPLLPPRPAPHHQACLPSSLNSTRYIRALHINLLRGPGRSACEATGRCQKATTICFQSRNFDSCRVAMSAWPSEGQSLIINQSITFLVLGTHQGSQQITTENSTYTKH